jgi:undecaprenyl-diphosphatase
VTAARVAHDVPSTAPAHEEHRHARDWSGLKRSPLVHHGLVVYVLAFLVFTGITIGLGLLVVHELGGIRHLDDDVARWFARHRTNTWDDLSWVGSGTAEAAVKIVTTAILSACFLWFWRRWNEIALLVGALVLEVSVFSIASFAVDRARPPVGQLDAIPPTGAFPSGHVAAAVAFYGAIAIIVCWHTRNRLGRGVAIAAVVVLPPIVGMSRMYRGMHHLSDVVVGAVIGAASLFVVHRIVLRPEDAVTAPPQQSSAAAITTRTSSSTTADDASSRS